MPPTNATSMSLSSSFFKSSLKKLRLKSCSWLSEIITVGLPFLIAHNNANSEGVASHPLK